ncbi:MAG: NAD(P)H-hydrate dehydratase [Oscillospiraceae bacterium]|nr:NAD(P)H-hydrate dehydratase [Oscillospiraceae bacterium]
MSRYISADDFNAAEKRALEKDISVKRAIMPRGGEIEIINKSKVFKLVKRRSPNSHKGTFGRLVCIVGSDRFMGAAQISALAALRSGVGLVQVITTKASALALSVAAKEATLLPLERNADGFIVASECALQRIEVAIESADAVLIGCGLRNTLDTKKILELVIEKANCPIIIDADGINALSTCIELLRKAKTDIVLTPHPAELARLCGVDTKEALAKRYELSKKLCKEFGVTVVAKSAATVISTSDKAYLSLCGNDGLAKGGSGDLLAGLIASFLAQGYTPDTAARLGVTVLGVGCEEVSKRTSRTGMLASDILDCLPMLFKKIERLR